MTSVMPPDWSNTNISHQPPYPLSEQGQYTPHQTGQQHNHNQQQMQQPYPSNDGMQQPYPSHDDMQQPYPSNNGMQQNYGYQQFNPPQYQRNDLPRQLAPLNQEYDLNYPQQQSYQKRSSRDLTLRSKTSKRVSKALPPDPLSRQRNRSLKNGSTNQSNVSLIKDLPLTPASTLDYQQHQGHNIETSTPVESQSNSQLSYLSVDTTPDSSRILDPKELVPYSPPPNKKGIPIERPYSFYKVAPKVPQSVTVIDSPFGPPAPAVNSHFEIPRNNTVNGNALHTYHTNPSQNNPFTTPVQYQPRVLQNQQQQQQPKQQQQQQQQSHKQVPLEERSRNDRFEQENSNSASHSAESTGIESSSKSSMNHRERSNSDNHSKMSSQRSNSTTANKTSETIARTRSRNNSSGQSGNQQSQLQERQQQPATHHQEDEDHDNTHTSSKPTRKESGGGFLKMARQASGTALRGMGLSRRPSEKHRNKDKVSQANDVTYEQNSQSWSNLGGRPQPELQQGQHHQGQHLNGPPQTFMRNYDAELERNRSLPDFKSPPSVENRGPGRGGSLTNPKSNPGPFHSRQKSQHQPLGTYQTATATSNEPFTATSSSATVPVIQDAYGGTTDDWRQRQQAEKEARERQNLRDSSPNERSGHTSMNSVSTLNLPPTTVNPTTSTLGRSTSRILLPDRNRNQSKADQSSQDDQIEEPTQESTSLAKATVQPGGILAQLQAATDVGQVIDPIATKDGHYIQRSNTAPFPQKESMTNAGEQNPAEVGGSKQYGSLEYSKSEGYSTVPRNNRQQQKHLPQQQHQHQHRHQHQHQQQQQQQQHSHRQHAQPQTQSYEQQFMTSLQNQYYGQSDPIQPPNQQMAYQGHYQNQQNHHNQTYQQQQRYQSTTSANKDLPPTPEKTQHNDILEQNSAYNKPQPIPIETGPHGQEQMRSRSGSHPESMRRQMNQSSGRNGSSGMTSDSALAFSRSLSPPPRRISHERSGSSGQLSRKGSNGQHNPSTTNLSGSSKKEKTQYGIDMLPLPVIPSPDESLGKNPNIGILPQDVLKTLNPTTIQKVITQAVIASRAYKVLSLEEVEVLKKEQDDLLKYIEALKVSLTIETRMRDASHSLIKLHESNTNIDAVKAATSQLHATTRKMDQIVQKSLQSMNRLSVVQRLLLQHESAVLNAGMRRLDGENRELGRAVQELEMVRDKEKEEKLKWKKEHSQLRIQSMIFPNPPGLEDYSGGVAAKGSDRNQSQHLVPRAPSPLSQQNQQQTAQLAALEKYMKELNDDISKKDERIGRLESQLRLIKVWANDFSQSLQTFGLSPNSAEEKTESEKQAELESPGKIQKQLAQLQARIEDGFRALEANAHELKTKAEEADIAKNKALEFAATTLANSTAIGVLERSSSSSSIGDSDIPRSKSRQKDQGSRVRSPFSRSKNAHTNSPYTQAHQNSNSDLNAVLNESLLELDNQLTSSPETVARSRHPRGEQPQQDGSKDTSHPKSSETKDELVIGDAHAEIKRLNAMVDELERLVMLKMTP